MEEEKTYPIAEFGPKIGVDVQTIKARRSRNLICFSAPDEPNSFIFARGRGPGSGLVATAEGASQLAIAEPLIQMGVPAKAAYRIAADFAIHSGSVGYWLGGEVPEYRQPNRLFEHGKTWLVCTKNSDGWRGSGGHSYFSDEDPALLKQAKSPEKVLSYVALSVGEPVDGSPRILLNISDVCFNLAKALKLNPLTAFGRAAE